MMKWLHHVSQPPTPHTKKADARQVQRPRPFHHEQPMPAYPIATRNAGGAEPGDKDAPPPRRRRPPPGACRELEDTQTTNRSIMNEAGQQECRATYLMGAPLASLDR